MAAGRLRAALRSSLGRTGATYRPPTSTDKPRRIVFVRYVRGFTGGHLKAWDYFNHVAASKDVVPYVWFAPGTVWDDRNPWFGADLERTGLPERPDALFLGGLSWKLIPPRYRRDDVPIVNLVQHVRHADADDPRSAFLERHAIRICVSPEVEQAVAATGRARGPIVTIPNGIDVDGIRNGHPDGRRVIDLLVVANKQPELGRRVANSLGDTAARIELIDSAVPRSELLDAISRARVAVFVPNEAEGFYLPALEAMALGAIVVCPDCVGNRSFCLPGQTAFRPPHAEGEIVAAARAALALAEADADAMRGYALAMAHRHDLQHERERFLDVLDHLDTLWRT
jgi:glycosyltransferase involved in cell wall biosynthesis